MESLNNRKNQKSHLPQAAQKRQDPSTNSTKCYQTLAGKGTGFSLVFGSQMVNNKDIIYTVAEYINKGYGKMSNGWGTHRHLCTLVNFHFSQASRFSHGGR